MEPGESLPVTLNSEVHRCGYRQQAWAGTFALQAKNRPRQMKKDAPQQDDPLREHLNKLRYIVRCGCHCRMMPHDLPPWQNVYHDCQQVTS